MKIVVVATVEDNDRAREVLSHLKTVGIVAQAYVIKENWRDSKQRLDELAASSSHVVTILTTASINSAWLSFLIGYCLGSEKPLVLYSSLRNTSISIFLTPFFRFSSLEELTAYLEAEAKEWSSIAQRREARKALLDFGVSFRDESFAESVLESNIHAVELFISAGLSLNTRDKRGTPLLCLAARKSLRPMVQLLIDAGAQIDIQSEDRGNTALMDAVAVGDEDLARLLLSAGASTEIVSKNGQSALVLAVGRKSPSLVKLLLEYGANPTLEDHIGFDARKYAILFQNAEIIDLLPSG